MKNILRIQQILQEMNIDGWLFYDFRGMNDIALQILGIGKKAHLTRRFFYYVPAKGTPTKIVNGIETHNLNHLPGTLCAYSSHTSLKNFLTETLKDAKIIALEYSPLNAIPYVSKVDAGTVEFLKSFGVELYSSGDLITGLLAKWSDDQYERNQPVATALVEIVKAAFEFIGSKLKDNNPVNEYDVQQFIMDEFERRNYETDYPPIVGVNENSANPHYGPDAETHKEIKQGDFVLIDLWAKQKADNDVWSDITWVGFAGSNIPEKHTNVFNIVAAARDAALDLVKTRFAKGEIIRGFEVDDACRKVIVDAGYEKYFIHRTGHSITTDLHGTGPNMDNFETHDERIIQPGCSFSIEPGIYLTGDFGVRSEIDVYIHNDGTVEQTSGIKQTEIIKIL